MSDKGAYRIARAIAYLGLCVFRGLFILSRHNFVDQQGVVTDISDEYGVFKKRGAE